MSLGLELSGGAGALFVLAVLAAFLWHARKSPAGWPLLFLRGLAALGLALALLKPSLALRQPVRTRPRLAILIDHSHSMGQRAGRASRLEAALSWLARHRRGIESRAEPVFYALAGQGARLSGWEDLKKLKPASAAFHPADSLRDIQDDLSGPAPPQRAWLFSDGNAEPVEDLGRLLGALRLPWDVLGVGPSRRGRDLSFLEIQTPDFAFLHGRLSLQASLEASGLSGERLALRLLRQEKDSWSLVDERLLSVSAPYEVLAATLSATAQTLGSESYRLEAVASKSLSRSREFRVEVIRQKYRIMYLSGRPSPEYAFLREFLKSNPNHEMVSFVILRNPENPTFVPDHELALIPFPAEEIFVRNLSQFDLFILENFSYTRFNLPVSYLASLRSFVAQGGALLVMGGENAFTRGGYRGTPLEDLLPVTLAQSSPDYVVGSFKPRPASLTHPLVQLYETPQAARAAWEALPPMEGYARFDSVRPGSTVLAVHPGERTAAGEPLPVMALREYGRGKVMLVSSDSTWRWRLGAAADWKIASFYPRFWTKAVEYLTGSLDLSKVKFAPLPDRLAAREPAVLSLRVFDEGFKPAEPAQTEVAVLWTSPEGRTRQVLPQQAQPGVYVLELTGLSPGPHRVLARARLRGKPWGEDQVRFTWRASPPETPLDRRWLKRAAAATGGAFGELEAASLEDLMERLPPVREEARVSRRLHPWASPYWLWLTVGLLLLEWGLRRWRGYA